VKRLRLLLALAALMAGPAVARAAVDVAVSAEDGTVYVDARFTGAFDEDLDAALRSGLPARVAVELVLWEERTGLWDREAARGAWEVRVVFDVVEEVYRVFDERGGTLLEAVDLAGVEEFVAGIELWPLCDFEDIDPDRDHYLGLSLTIEPLTIDEVRDLERWLRGNVREGGRLRDVPGQLVGVLRSRLGLGTQTERGRSAEFRPAALPPPG
jgi:hypothetical protein